MDKELVEEVEKAGIDNTVLLDALKSSWLKFREIQQIGGMDRDNFAHFAMDAFNDPKVSEAIAQAIIPIVLERCASVIAEQKASFQSEGYAIPQPMGSFSECFACDQIDEAIRNLGASQ